jgi:3-deoxy-D-manno-octulosonate 8-phosphate phosphatase (KDO 8-P phosphatase)
VLTDGRLYFGADGEALKVFHVRDGHGIKAVQQAGIRVAVISGRDSAAVTQRCAELGITDIMQGVSDKPAALASLCIRLGLTPRECACVGDDTVDASLFREAGFAVAVADAHVDARRAAHRCTALPGGAGAVREVCDWLLGARRRREP